VPILLDPNTGKKYDVPEEEQASAREKYGFIAESETDAAKYGTADDPTGEATTGLGGQVMAAGVGALRKVAGAASFVSGKPVQDIAPSAFTQTASTLAGANPTALGIGGAVPAVAAGFALPVAGAAGLASAIGLAGVDAAAGEELNSQLEGRSFDASKFVGTAGIDLALQAATHGLFKGLGYAYSNAAPATRKLVDRFRGVVSRGGGDEAEAVAAQKVLADAVQSADELIAGAPSPKVASNPIAQKNAIEDLAIQLGETDPAIARELRAAAEGTARQRHQALTELLDTASDNQAEAISGVLGQESLWGAKAVEHAAATDVARAAKPEVDNVADSVSNAQAHGIMRKESEIVADLRKSLGGGTKAEKGHLQTWNDAMSVVSNSEKRADFGAMFAELPEATRAEASAHLRELAQSSQAVVDALDSVGAKQGGKRLQGFIDAAIEDGTPASADRLKNALQFQRKALAKKGVNDVVAENAAQIVDEFEQPLRHALETPEIVGDRIAELQRTRNKLWSDTEDGFIRNSQKLKANGFDMFNVVEVNYDTGKLVMQVDRKALDSLIAAPQHIAQPALENLEAMARSTRAMADDLTRLGGRANKAEAGTLKKASEGILEKVRGIRELHAAREATGASGVAMATDIAAEAGGRVAGVVPGAGGFVKNAIKGAEHRLGEAFASQRVARKAVDVDAVSRYVEALRSHPGGAEAAQKIDEALGDFVMKRSGTGAVSDVAAGIRAKSAARTSQSGALDFGPAGPPAPDSAAQQLEHRWSVMTNAAAKGIAIPSLARKLVRGAAGSVSAPLSRFMGSDETLAQAYNRTREQVDAAHPEALASSTDEDVRGAPPHIAEEAIRQQVKVLAYVQSIAPKPVGVSVVRPKGRQASYQEMRDYALKVDAATHPEHVFEDAAHGQLRREQLEALQATWPARYEELKQQTIVQLAHSTTTSRQRAALLFNLGPEIDQALGPEVSTLAAQAREKAQSATGQSSPRPPTRGTPKSMASVVPAGQAALSLGKQITFGAQ
jgi:hypothetical protein